ncbi:MAG: hypothetical protein ACM3U2_06825 [Deltaproteobacteria bacterium]
MRRRSSSHSPISLFTFLDTLVCTMGSLILMLLAMTPKIRERAEARELARLAALAPAVEPDADPVPPDAAVPPVPARPSPEEEQERAAAQQKRHEACLAVLAEARETLQKREAEYRRRRQLMKEAGTQVKDLEDQMRKARAKEAAVADASQSLTELETKLEEQQAKIAQKIALTRKNIDLLNRQQSGKANEYALVPYEGTSGSVRRPIYLECSGQGFRFLPEDETVSPVDLKGFQENYNPLLTGTQVLLRYWSRRRRESGGAEPEPYVLLLVRPSGCLNYYVARSFLSSLGTNFGYELIEEDWKLSVPKPDPVAKVALKETLDRTVQAQSEIKDALADAAQRGSFGGRNPGRGGFSEDSLPGDGDVEPGGPPFGASPRGNRKPSIQFGPAARRSRDVSGGAADGDGSKNAGAGAGSGGVTTPGRRMGTGTGSGTKAALEAGAGIGGGSGSEGATRSGAGSGGRTLASRPAGIDGGAKPGAGGRQEAPGGNDTGGVTGGAGGDRSGDDSVIGSRRRGGGAADGTPGATGGNDFDSAPGAESGEGSPGGKGGTTATPNASGSGRGGSRGRRSPGRVGSRPATLGGAPADGDTGDSTGDGDVPLEIPLDYVPGRLLDADGNAGTRDVPFAPRANPQDSSDDSSVGSSSVGGDPFHVSGASKSKTGSAASGSATSGENGSDSGAAAATSTGDSSITTPDSGDGSSGGSPGQVQIGNPGARIRLNSQPERKASGDPADGPRLGQDDAKTGGSRGRAMGPRLWGRARPRATIGLERKLEVRVLSDRILVGSKDVVVPVGKGETAEELLNHVVAGIDHAAEKWGEPPASFYWLPTVKFVVYPGGNQYYERLHEPLERQWGVTSTMEYAPETRGDKANNKPGSKAGKSATGVAP